MKKIRVVMRNIISFWSAWDLYFGSSSRYTGYSDRYYGQTVRPVQGFTE